jgi:hypothetical protein
VAQYRPEPAYVSEEHAARWDAPLGNLVTSFGFGTLVGFGH